MMAPARARGNYHEDETHREQLWGTDNILFLNLGAGCMCIHFIVLSNILYFHTLFSMNDIPTFPSGQKKNHSLILEWHVKNLFLKSKADTRKDGENKKQCS